MKPTSGLNRARQVLGRLWRAVKESRGLINTTDLMVASGAAIILAAGVAAVATEGVDQAKYGKAQPDAVSLATAMSKFFGDTGKWPGQKELVDDKASATGKRYLHAGGTAAATNLPVDIDTKFDHATTTTCKGNSGTGAADKDFVAVTPAAANFLDINKFLVQKPAEADYPNWKGPYLPADIKSDPWDKVWVINVLPLFCAEAVTNTTTGSNVATGGEIGYGWILSAGSNRSLQTDIKDAKLNVDGDDAGVNLGKLIQRSGGGRNN